MNSMDLIILQGTCTLPIQFINSDIRYRYYNLDAWAGYNINSTRYTTEEEDKKLRKLIALRVIDQQFQDLPGKYII